MRVEARTWKLRVSYCAVLYFDYNATAPLSAIARDAWLDATERFVGNPSSPHRLGARAEAALDEAREKLAAILGCDARTIVWTSGATESSNAVFHHAARSGQGDVWFSAVEHPCVRQAACNYFPESWRDLPVDADGQVSVESIERDLLRGKPRLIAVMAANNETGVLQPWREVAALCREHAVPFFCDAAQWIGKMPGAGLGDCDFVSGCAHKFGGPQGVGFLKCPTSFTPLLRGGGQEDGRRAGTENVAAILAMVAALEDREKQMEQGGAHERIIWRKRIESQLVKELPSSAIIGQGADRLWNTVSAVMPERDCRQRWVVKLDKLGFAVSTGSACASGKEAPSHVLSAMGVSSSIAGRVLRFSSGWETSPAEWSALLDGVVRGAAEMAPGSGRDVY